MAGAGNAIRGSRVGAGPMGEAERGGGIVGGMALRSFVEGLLEFLHGTVDEGPG